jgi:hypothetical protein
VQHITQAHVPVQHPELALMHSSEDFAPAPLNASEEGCRKC